MEPFRPAANHNEARSSPMPIVTEESHEKRKRRPVGTVLGVGFLALMVLLLGVVALAPDMGWSIRLGPLYMGGFKGARADALFYREDSKPGMSVYDHGVAGKFTMCWYDLGPRLWLAKWARQP